MSTNESGALSAVFTSSTIMIRLGRYLLCHAKMLKMGGLHDSGLDREKPSHM